MVKSFLNIRIIPMILIHILLIKNSFFLFILFKNQIFIDPISFIWSNLKVVLFSIVYPILIGIITPIRKYKWCFSFKMHSGRVWSLVEYGWRPPLILDTQGRSTRVLGTLLRSHALDLIGCMHPSLGLFRSNTMENNGLYIDLYVPRSIPYSEEHA